MLIVMDRSSRIDPDDAFTSKLRAKQQRIKFWSLSQQMLSARHMTTHHFLLKLGTSNFKLNILIYSVDSECRWLKVSSV